ncbi:MAG: hypothetical protein ACFFCW_33245 [Candidatus Hodarchaeota archaeon]
MRTNSSWQFVAVACMMALMYTLFQVSAWATSIQVLSLEKLTQNSSDVIQGKVIKIESFWNKRRTAIYTRVTVSRGEVLKGSVPSEVAVFLPGGTVGGRTTMVIGAPEFKHGQEVVLFLSRATDYKEEVELPTPVVPFHLTDLFQGKFDVMIDPATGQKKAVSNAVKLIYQPGVKPEMLPPGGLKGLPLTDLVTRIRQVR